MLHPVFVSIGEFTRFVYRPFQLAGTKNWLNEFLHKKIKLSSVQRLKSEFQLLY